MSWSARLLSVIALCAAMGCTSSVTVDADFPPGDPVLADNRGDSPAIGVEGARDADTDYGLLTVMALCLIGAGVLLLSVERCGRRADRSGH